MKLRSDHTPPPQLVGTTRSVPVSQDRLGVTPGRPQFLADLSNRWSAIRREPVEPMRDLNPHVPRIVDSRRHRHKLAGGPQLIDERGRDPQPGGHRVGRRGLHTFGRKGRKQKSHALAHDRIQGWTGAGHLDPVARPQQCPGVDHAIHHGPQLAVAEHQRLPAPMASGATGLAGTHLAYERVDANVPPQR